MVLLIGQNDYTNVIHVAYGPETEFWMDLHGGAAVNITELLKTADPNKPVFLHLTRCRAEALLAESMKVSISKGEGYPFAPPAVLFAPTSQPIPQMMPATPSDLKSGPVQSASALKKVVEAFGKPQVLKGKCTECSTEAAELVPGLTPAICYACVRLDIEVAKQRKKDISDVP